MVVLALVIGAVTGQSAPSTASSNAAPKPLTLGAPPQASAQAANCAKVLARLPVRLIGLDPRVVHTTPETPNVVAWGNPAVILRCGVARPASLVPNSGEQFFALGGASGPFFAVTRSGGSNVYTTVDRAAYVSVEVPKQYNSAPMPALSRAIAAALPAVCSTLNTDPVNTLCTRRT